MSPTAGPELTLNSAPWQGGLAEHCPLTASIPQHSIQSLAEHPSPCKASVLALCAHSHCSCCCQATMLCCAVPCCAMLDHCIPAPSLSTLSTTPRSCRGFDHLYSRCSSSCPHHRILEMSPTETGTTGEPRVAGGGLGTGRARPAVSLPCVPILLCPSSPVPLPGSAVPRVSCDSSQFQCAPVQPLPLEPCPG